MAQKKRQSAVKPVRDGASVTATAQRFGMSRSTLHRWLHSFDPDHPAASLWPRKAGPKGPRWTQEALDILIRLVEEERWAPGPRRAAPGFGRVRH